MRVWSPRQSLAAFIAIALLGAGGAPGSGAWAAQQRQGTSGNAPRAAADSDLDSAGSELKPLIERYADDRGAVGRTYPVPYSSRRAERFKKFYGEWQERLAKVNYAGLSLEGKVDYVLFANLLKYEQRQLEIQSKQFAEMEAMLPFAKLITALEETRRQMQPVKSQDAAGQLAQMPKQIEEVQRRLEAGFDGGGRRGGGQRGGESAQVTPPAAPIEALKIKKAVANRAVAAIAGYRNALRAWYGFYSGYDPVFTWWNEAPYREADQALGNYANFVSQRVVGVQLTDGDGQRGGQGGQGGGGGTNLRAGQAGGRPQVAARVGDASDIVGDPIGHDALIVELENEMIPYTPEDLIALAEKELKWCEAEMVKASRELGYGDDWKKALEHVKNLYVEPGKQPQLILDLANEATRYVEENDLVSVPPLAKETWRMDMMTPERQLQSPFFLGGEQILVSYPTNTMSHEAKMMSMRGNNPHFSRATVHHELIPGHHLQQFMTGRHKSYRSVFSTPFWGEGWALYWELMLWDRGFAKKPEDRIGMLFWRMHRCARIVFSLSFHLEKMTPQQCIDLLVERVGHERENAAAEVRRSFAGTYSPLYQIAYLIGGLQFYALQKELVGGGKMTNKQFHDTILRENRIPVEMVRAILMKAPPEREFKSVWKFYGN